MPMAMAIKVIMDDSCREKRERMVLVLSHSHASVEYECDCDGGDFHHCDDGGGADVGGKADDASDMQNLLLVMVTMVRTTVVAVTKCEFQCLPHAATKWSQIPPLHCAGRKV